jgi:lysophospholipase L1-like esterase
MEPLDPPNQSPTPSHGGLGAVTAVAKNALLVLGATALFFGLGEAVTRLFGGVRYGGWGDPASVRLVSKQYYANSRGLRDREITPERGPGEFRILCLGDSYTWGQMVPANTAYPKALERLLAEKPSRTRPVVINAGQLGWSTTHEAAWLVREGLRYRPDVILVGFFLNDAEVDHYALERLLPEPLERRLAGSYFYFFLKYRIHLLRVRFGLAESYTDYLLRLYEPGSAGWAQCREALARIDDAARSIHARVLVLILPVIQDWSAYPFGRIHEAVAEECRALGIPVEDLLPAFRASPLPWKDLRVGPNDEHPNAEGHALIAREALAALERNGLAR